MLYEPQSSSRYQSSRTATYQLGSEPPATKQTAAPLLGTASHSTGHSTTTQTVREQRHYTAPQSDTRYYEKTPASATKTESHYQTVRTVSEQLAAGAARATAGRQPQVIEYTEEVVPADPRARAQSRTTRTVSEWKSQAAPTTYTYYEEPPSVERRVARTVTQYRYPAVGSPPPEVPPPPQRVQYHGGTEYADGAPVTVRYVDRRPITVYHDSGYAASHELSSPPRSAPVSPRSDPGAPTVYYERIIERQPIIHYYGGRPDDEPRPPQASRTYTLPAVQRLTTTATTQLDEQRGTQTRSAATLPPGHTLSSSTQTTRQQITSSDRSPSSVVPAARSPGLQVAPRGRSPDPNGGTVRQSAARPGLSPSPCVCRPVRPARGDRDGCCAGPVPASPTLTRSKT